MALAIPAGATENPWLATTSASANIQTPVQYVAETPDAWRTGEVQMDVAAVAQRVGLRPDDANADAFGRVSLRWNRVEPTPAGEIDARTPYAVTSPSASAQAIRFSDVAPRTGARDSAGPQDSVQLGYRPPVARAYRQDGLTLDIAPRADVTVGDSYSGARIGALVRLGQDLSADRPRTDGPDWYLFAGADAQALTWRPSGPNQPGVALRYEDDQAMIGDIQAGVAVRVRGGDLAFGYVQREYSYRDASSTEQFVGVTFVKTW